MWVVSQGSNDLQRIKHGARFRLGESIVSEWPTIRPEAVQRAAEQWLTCPGRLSYA